MPHITITPAGRRVTVSAGPTVIATSDNALELREGSYPPVIYVPRSDARMDLMDKTARATTCPHKGQASYYTIHAAAGDLPDAVWSYEEPKADVAAIAGHLAFYPSKVTITA
jgi:uncharacterized protein (DUF427 family)